MMLIVLSALSLYLLGVVTGYVVRYRKNHEKVALENVIRLEYIISNQTKIEKALATQEILINENKSKQELNEILTNYTQEMTKVIMDVAQCNTQSTMLVLEFQKQLKEQNLMAYQNSSVFNKSVLDSLILVMGANDYAEVVAGSDTDEKITDSSVAFELALNTSDFTNQDKRFLNKDKVQAYIDKCDSESVSTFTVKCKNLSSNNLNDGATNIYFDIGTSLNNNLLPDAI